MSHRDEVLIALDEAFAGALAVPFEVGILKAYQASDEVRKSYEFFAVRTPSDLRNLPPADFLRDSIALNKVTWEGLQFLLPHTAAKYLELSPESGCWDLAQRIAGLIVPPLKTFSEKRKLEEWKSKASTSQWAAITGLFELLVNDSQQRDDSISNDLKKGLDLLTGRSWLH